jgi:hypothetical protein
MVITKDKRFGTEAERRAPGQGIYQNQVLHGFSSNRKSVGGDNELIP